MQQPVQTPSTPATAWDELAAAYSTFREMFGTKRLIQPRTTFALALKAAGILPRDVTRQWMTRLDPKWVYLQSNLPFSDDPVSNLTYQRLIHMPPD